MPNGRHIFTIVVKMIANQIIIIILCIFTYVVDVFLTIYMVIIFFPIMT